MKNFTIKKIESIENFLELLPLVGAFKVKSGFADVKTDNKAFLNWVKFNIEKVLMPLQIFAVYDNLIPCAYIIFEKSYNYYMPIVFVYQCYSIHKEATILLKKELTNFAIKNKTYSIRMITFPEHEKAFSKLFDFKLLGVLMEMEV